MAKPLNVPNGLQLGPLGYRVVAALFDAVIGAVIWYPFFHFWGYYYEAEKQYQVKGLPALAMFFAIAAYWILSEWIFGATIGKLICDLRVVSVTGKRCSFGQSVKRNLLRIVDFFPFYLTGFIAAKLSPLRQRLGDQWAKTIVVKKDRRPVPEAAPQTPPFS